MLRLGASGRGFPSSSAFGVIPTFCSPLFLPSCFRASPGGMWTFISGVAHSVIFFFWGGENLPPLETNLMQSVVL